MLVTVAYMIAVASLVGPSQAAMTRGCPSANARLMESPAITGSSTNRPRAMISVATENCWISLQSRYKTQKVIARVMEMKMAISKADRHSQKTSHDTNTTSAMASYSA